MGNRPAQGLIEIAANPTFRPIDAASVRSVESASARPEPHIAESVSERVRLRTDEYDTWNGRERRET